MEISEIQVKKKSGNLENWNRDKISVAVGKSADRIATKLSENEINKVVSLVEAKINFLGEPIVEVSRIHSFVEQALKEIRPDVAESYMDYRNWVKKEAQMNAEVWEECQSIQFLGDKSNSNADSAMVSTKRVKKLDALETAQLRRYFLNAEEKAAEAAGYIYIHDKNARLDTSNCCIADLASILTGGFEMSNVWYNEPKTLDVAGDVCGDVVLMMASQQYGGFSIPEVDKLLEPYAEKSYQLYLKKYIEKCHMNQIDASKLAEEDVYREMDQVFQGWEYKFNTVASSRGDYPFITCSFGLSQTKWGRALSKSILKVRKNGQGKEGHKKPVLFPKLVFLYDENLHGPGKPLEDVFEAGIECSMRTMYPDWLSLTGEGYVASIYKQYGLVITPMGCKIGTEVITYKYNGELYIESFKRFWDKISKDFPVLEQFKGNPDYLYIDTSKIDLFIYDTLKGFTHVNTLIRNKSNNFVRVNFTNGRNSICTEDHPFETINRGVVHAKDLQPSDSIIINNNSYSEETKVVDDDYAWLLGLLLCDGCYQNYSIFVSIAENSENEIEERFHKTFEKYFGLKTKTVVHHRGYKENYKDLRVIGDNTAKISEIIEDLTALFGGVNKKNRHIPNEVFSWNYSAKMAFFAGIIDADGSVVKNTKKTKANTVRFGSTNRELALQEMYLAQTLGYPTKIYCNHYYKQDKNKIRYNCETIGDSKLATFLTCEKKANRIIETESSPSFHTEAFVLSIQSLNIEDFSYDVSTDSEHFEVNGLYSHNCRAFLSPWYERGGIHPADENDVPVFVGRSNIGVVSLNLPMIYQKAKRENKDFYETLDYYLEMIRKIHLRTYDYLGHMKASMNSLGYCEGGFYGGHLNLDDMIAPVIRSWTASFGITALNELQELHNQKSLVEDGDFALEVMEYINKKVTEFKEEDGYLYALYGSPAESLCGTQVKQFRKEFGIITGVSDRPYVSNSFHCHVTEDITPIQKQDLEYRFWNLMNGGKIQYVKYPIDYNKEAVKTLIRRAMDMGFYEGVNLSLAYCDDCGHQELEMDVCPKCGSKNLTKIDRMNGLTVRIDK